MFSTKLIPCAPSQNLFSTPLAVLDHRTESASPRLKARQVWEHISHRPRCQGVLVCSEARTAIDATARPLPVAGGYVSANSSHQSLSGNRPLNPAPNTCAHPSPSRCKWGGYAHPLVFMEGVMYSYKHKYAVKRRSPLDIPPHTPLALRPSVPQSPTKSELARLHLNIMGSSGPGITPPLKALPTSFAEKLRRRASVRVCGSTSSATWPCQQ